MDAAVSNSKLEPFSLRDAPSLIERIWPAQKISVEAQKERKAVHGQTLTGLGSYWKGRKPLILARACLLAALLPSTDDDEKDLAIFEVLAGMSDQQIIDRFKTPLTIEEIETYATPQQRSALLEENNEGVKIRKLSKVDRATLMSDVLARMPYQVRVEKLLRPEEVSEDLLTATRMNEINEHLGTTARTLPELVEQLGIMRFGHRPQVGDTFCGGGSIPFEAARLGCDVYASDLNPIACMLTWGDLNIVTTSSEHQKDIEDAQEALADTVEAELCRLRIEHDANGNRAKVYLYCLETRCPQTGWMVPLAPTWVISELRNVIAVLVPEHKAKRFKIDIRDGATKKEMMAAAQGTVQNGRLVYSLDGETYSTPIKTIRGDRRTVDGETINDLRRWAKEDFSPRSNDVFQERLYCIQWIKKGTIAKARQETFFAAPTDADTAREKQVAQLVQKDLSAWQAAGYVSDMEIETGRENEGPIRTNGWMFWHHMFMPRAILTAVLIAKHGARQPHAAFSLLKYLDNNSKSCRWKVSQSGGDGGAVSTFDS
jgi:putative DNA methylase